MSYRADDHDHYRDAIAEGVARGARFASLYASNDPAGAVVRTVLREAMGGLRIETVPVRDGRVPSIVDLMGAAEWSEREARDLHGIAFDGHEPLRPLVDHAATLAEWTVPVRGADVYQVAVGPIHAGIIESGHFRFHVVGDRILHLDARLFYKHRGLERAAIGSSLDEGIAYAARACAACAVTNRVAYAHAAEQLLGLRADAGVARARTILLELERLWSHLNDIAAICSGAGMAAGSERYSALSEDARRLNAVLSGHRLLFDSVHVGESRLSLDAARCADARETLERIRADAARAWRSLLFNGSFQDRLAGVGVLDATAALTLGAVGPAARASGLADDARAVPDGRLSYDGLRTRARFPRDGRRPRALRTARARAASDPLVARRSARTPARSVLLHGDRAGCGDRGEPCREPAWRDRLRARTRRRARGTTAAAHGLLRQLARPHERRTGRAAAGLPAHQQELRALLRLRRPLMFTLLRDLRELRRRIHLGPPASGGSLALRHVDAGSCNGCEHELTVVANPHYDLQRFGLSVVASPRHADVLLVTGPVTIRMHHALVTAYKAMPEPRRVAALGNCALGCGVLGDPRELVGSVEQVLPVHLRIPGCPPTPTQIAEGLISLLDGRANLSARCQTISDPSCSSARGR